MPRSRREFLAYGSAGLLGAAIQAKAQNPAPAINQNPSAPPGAPPAFGTAPPVGPEVSAATFAEAERLLQVQLSDQERKQAAGNWRESMAALYERRTGPRKVALGDTLAPYSHVNPVLPGHGPVPTGNQ